MFNNYIRKYYADDVELNVGSGGKTIATLDVSGVQHEKVISEFLVAGVPVMVDAANPLPTADVAAELSLASIDLKINDGTQKTQIVDAGGEAATVTGGKLDVNATFSGDIEIGAVEIKNATTDDRTAVINTAPTTEFGLVTRNIPSGTQPVSAASLPLPTGAATAANQQTNAITDAQIRATPLPVSGTVAVTGAGDATAANQAIEIASLSVLDDWDESDRAKANIIVGQAGVQAGAGAVSANTQRVVIATDQTAIPISGTVSVGAVDNTQLYSNTLSVTGAITGIDTTGYASILFNFSGIWSGVIIVEGSADNSVWEQKIVLDVNEISMQDIINENGIFQIKTTSKYVRINVVNVTGTITALILGRTGLGVNASDAIAFAMDKTFNMPLYVEETATKKDLSKALIPSDAPEPVYGSAAATSSVIFKVDTTGYQSIVVQCITFGSNITVQTSNDGITWASLLGFTGTAATGSALLTGAGMWEYPVMGKFCRGVMAAANFTNCLVYLRQRPINPWNVLAGGPVNLQAIGGTASQSYVTLNSIGGASTFGGTLAVGGATVPGSSTVAYPIIVGGREAPSDGAVAGKTRVLLTDTLGKAIVTGDIPAASSNQNVKSIPTQEISLFEGQSQIEILGQILLELRINNQLMSELPLVLQGKTGSMDEPAQFRNEQSLFAV